MWYDFNLGMEPAVALVVGFGPYFESAVVLEQVKAECHSIGCAVHVIPESHTLLFKSVADGSHHPGRVAMNHTVPLNIHVEAIYIQKQTENVIYIQRRSYGIE